MQIKVKDTKMHIIRGNNPHIEAEIGTVLVTEAKLVLIECNIKSGEGILFFSKEHKSFKPILISETEKIEVGDWVYQNRGNGDVEIFQIKNEYQIARDIQKKTLALPEHF